MEYHYELQFLSDAAFTPDTAGIQLVSTCIPWLQDCLELVSGYIWCKRGLMDSLLREH